MIMQPALRMRRKGKQAGNTEGAEFGNSEGLAQIVLLAASRLAWRVQGFAAAVASFGCQRTSRVPGLGKRRV